MPAHKMHLFGRSGQRKYLTEPELRALLETANSHSDKSLALLCQILVWTGCRLSEALGVKRQDIDPHAGFICFESLKKRKRGQFRAVPVSDDLMQALMLFSKSMPADKRLWPMARNTAWGHIKTLMLQAGVSPAQAYPRALRHSFGVLAVQKGIPLGQVQKWLGHASIQTTTIYTQAIGMEERRLAERMWGENH